MNYKKWKFVRSIENHSLAFFQSLVLKERANALCSVFKLCISQDVTVKDAYRHQGLGSRIIGMLVERLHRDGIEWIGLIAENHSDRLYRKLGFRRMADATPLVRQQ